MADLVFPAINIINNGFNIYKDYKIMDSQKRSKFLGTIQRLTFSSALTYASSFAKIEIEDEDDKVMSLLPTVLYTLYCPTQSNLVMDVYNYILLIPLCKKYKWINIIDDNLSTIRLSTYEKSNFTYKEYIYSFLEVSFSAICINYLATVVPINQQWKYIVKTILYSWWVASIKNKIKEYLAMKYNKNLINGYQFCTQTNLLNILGFNLLDHMILKIEN